MGAFTYQMSRSGSLMEKVTMTMPVLTVAGGVRGCGGKGGDGRKGVGEMGQKTGRMAQNDGESTSLSVNQLT